ncbi:MAG: recombinase family protein, partial [bacterium]|nr:recombinase family protein [bacterium]
MAHEFFLYARKSTDSEERQILSIESQIAELRLFAEKEKLVVKQELIEAMTAKIPGRPIFNEMISRIEKGEACGIISWHPDRLARNSIDGGRIVYLLDTGHIKFLKFPTFWFENTPQGKFMLNIAFGQSKYYIDNLSENVKRGLRQKLRRGEWPGWAPLGYINDKNLRKVVMSPSQSPLVRRLFEEYATGKYTLEDLKRESFKWGLLSRTGKPLVKAEIHRTLTRPFYYGLMKYTGEWHQGAHEPLITKELFDKVQAALARNGKPNKYKKHKFPLLGLAVCASCGCSITAERQKGHHYYRCTKKKGKCPEPYVREEKLSEQISQIISNVALPTDIYQKMLAEWVKEQANASQPVALHREALEKEIHVIKAKLDKLLDAHLEGLIEKSEYQDKKETLLKKKVELEERMAKFEKGATGWLEPCREFLQAAHQAHQVAIEENLESQRDFL